MAAAGEARILANSILKIHSQFVKAALMNLRSDVWFEQHSNGYRHRRALGPRSVPPPRVLPHLRPCRLNASWTSSPGIQHCRRDVSWTLQPAHTPHA